jgi:hypothetical protein
MENSHQTPSEELRVFRKSGVPLERALLRDGRSLIHNLGVAQDVFARRIWVAHASRMLAMTSPDRKLSVQSKCGIAFAIVQKKCFGATRNLTGKTQVLAKRITLAQSLERS